MEQAVQLRHHFGGSIIDAARVPEPGVHIHVFKAPPSDYKEIGLPWELTFDLDHRAGSLLIAGWHVRARITFGPRLAVELWTDRKGGVDFPGLAFENIFRVAVTYRLQENGGMLIHSAGIVDNGSAVLFPGRSDDGKSTLSRLSLKTGRSVLSDDMNALTWADDTPMLEKVPFSGDLGRTWRRSSAYPLKGILGLQKAEVTTVKTLPISQAVALMVASAPYLNDDMQRMTDLLAQVYRIAIAVPTGVLCFRSDEDCWPVIQRYLSEKEKK